QPQDHLTPVPIGRHDGVGDRAQLSRSDRAPPRRADRPRRRAVHDHDRDQHGRSCDRQPFRPRRERAMTAVDTAPPDGLDPSDWILQRAISPKRRVFNGLATAWMIGSLVLALVPVVIIAVYVVSKGAGVISIDFLTKDLPVVTQNPGGGIGPAIVGTLI